MVTLDSADLLTGEWGSMVIRAATSQDLSSILEIYNDAVLTSAAIWTDDPSNLAERAGWLAEHDHRDDPVLVAEVADRIVGYAAFGPWRSKSGYRHTVDDSIYVRPGEQGAGIGFQLLSSLIELARARGYHVMIADIEAGNEASIRLHAKLGFAECGTIREVGIKFGRWLDLTVMRLQLS